MARDPFQKTSRECPRGCGETLVAYPEVIDLTVEQHIARDHEPPWDEVPGWPRGAA